MRRGAHASGLQHEAFTVACPGPVIDILTALWGLLLVGSFCFFLRGGHDEGLSHHIMLPWGFALSIFGQLHPSQLNSSGDM